MNRRFILLTQRQARDRHTGFSLVEVLVAVVVLAVGLLGLAALQIKGLQSAHAAYQRTLASIIAQDAAERLWLARASGASPSTVQTQWLANWQGSNAAGAQTLTLPGIAAGSHIAGLGNGALSITVQWSEGRFADDHAAASSFVYRITLPDN